MNRCITYRISQRISTIKITIATYYYN